MRIDNVPMYGQPEVVRPAVLVKADQYFIEKVESEFGDRREASRIWWNRAERFMVDGNLDYAMRRYNQAWLLDPENYQPYWGFARVVAERGEIDKAIEFLEKSKSLVDDKFQEVALLSDMATMYSVKAEQIVPGSAEQTKYFSLANEHFASSIALENSYGPAYRRWAFSLFEQGRYNEAWEKVKKARELKSEPFPKSFLEALEAKLAELL